MEDKDEVHGGLVGLRSVIRFVNFTLRDSGVYRLFHLWSLATSRGLGSMRLRIVRYGNVSPIGRYLSTRAISS